MILLRKVLEYLLVISVILSFFPEFFNSLSEEVYRIIDQLSFWLFFILYLVSTRKYNWIYITAISIVIIAKYISNYHSVYYNYAIVLFGFSVIAFILTAQREIFRVTTKSVLILAIPFLMILICSYLLLTEEIEYVGINSINFFLLTIGFFLFFSGTLYFNNRSRNNLQLFLSSVFLMAAAIVNGFNLIHHSFNIERFTNIFFVFHHYFMFVYITKQRVSVEID